LRTRTLVLVALAIGAVAYVATRGLAGSLSYYMTPSDVARSPAAVEGRDIRVGGLVEPGSVTRTGSMIRFVLTDGTTSLPVIQTTGVPPLFRGGSGAVVEGVYQADGIFMAQDVIVKHDNVYGPPSPGAAVP
jgi:cytochrome c-type biogenesis protein CcmE